MIAGRYGQASNILDGSVVLGDSGHRFQLEQSSTTGACSKDYESYRTEYETAKARWNEPTCYKFVYSVPTMSTAEPVQTTVTVRNGVADGGGKITIDYLFSEIETCFVECPTKGPVSCRIRYGGAGYPLQIQIDGNIFAVGDENNYILHNFLEVDCSTLPPPPEPEPKAPEPEVAPESEPEAAPEAVTEEVSNVNQDRGDVNIVSPSLEEEQNSSAAAMRYVRKMMFANLPVCYILELFLTSHKIFAF